MKRSRVRLRDGRTDARTTAAGLAISAPIALAMITGSAAATAFASVIALTVSLVSPMTGLIALAVMSPFPRPLVIPAPGLYVAMVGAVLLGVILRLPIDRPRLRWPSPEVSFIGAFLLYVAIHFVGGPLDGPWSSRSSEIASSFAVMMTGVLAFIAAMLVLRDRSPYPILAALLASAVLASATGIAEAMGGEGLFGDLLARSEQVNATAVDRATGPFGDPNYFGAYLAAATTLGIACLVLAGSRRLRAVILMVTAFIGLALLLTLSRGALVALVAGLLTMAFTRGIRVGLMVLAAVFLVAVIAWPMFADVRYAANPALASGGLASQLEYSDRTGAWLAGVDAFQSSPLFGVGWGRLVEESSLGIAAHNWYVAVLAETGIVGLLLWVLFIVSAVATLRRRPPSARTVGYAMLATWTVASLFIEVPRVYGSSGLVFFALAAAIAADWAPRDLRAGTLQAASPVTKDQRLLLPSRLSGRGAAARH